MKRLKNDRLTIYDAANSEAARVILADIDGNGGPESLACRWARLVIERGGLSVLMTQMPEPAQGVLFQTSEVTNVLHG